MNAYLKIGSVALILLCLGAGSYYAYGALTEQPKPSYRLGEAKRGDLVSTITATGTVEPEELVDVGAQVTGQILSFGKDENGKAIDYGSRVKTGTVLLQIDDSTYQAEFESAEATLKQAEASLVNAKADMKHLKAKLTLAKLDMERAEKLKNGTMSKADYDSFSAALAVAEANLDVGDAKILEGDANLLAAKATLSKARRNLSYCTIRSPVDGVVIDRRVNIGQTVVSSMSTSSLFLIAKDLRKMQVWVSVNEADIGKIKPGQTANFSVDAFQGETFKGVVSKIRLNASMSQNVVTYTVEVATDNSAARLLPYLTANVVFEVERTANALTVPNAALRWSPKGYFAGADAKGAGLETVWLSQGDSLKPVKVKALSTDGALTAVEAKEGLSEGSKLVLGQLSAKDSTAAKKTTNPFLPQFKRNAKQAGPPPPP
jgi:HlyD family secretion protein